MNRSKCINYVIENKVISFTFNDDKYDLFLQSI